MNISTASDSYHTTMSPATATPSTPLLTSVLFARGVISRLEYWPALRIAVDQGWGGPESGDKRTWIASVIVDAFEQQEPPPDDQYIEEILLQVMEDEFMANLEDGSAEGVAKDIVHLWEDIHGGKQDLVAQFEEQAEKLRETKPRVSEVCNGSDWEDGEDKEDESEEDAPELLNRGSPQVDEDGFTLVQSKGRARE